ncbi:signal transduction histidine kinase [Pedobacter metabolipauper]|uniref:histidine kinase n=2 Tax=Pedobacter metabolipauper TaxID=425513 RepID=A0A4R6T217_9SPHI|nr:signal transduction histidine kinase [Pedobacter metabolipauper]
MRFNRIVDFFMPGTMRDNPNHPDYNEIRVVVSTCLIGMPLMLLFPPVLYYMDKPISGFIINDVLVMITLLCIKFFGHYRIPMSITALVTYFIIYGWIENSGLIYSPNISLLHMYLLCAIWADKRYGWWLIFSNLMLFGFIYYQTTEVGMDADLYRIVDRPLYPLVMNCLITIFFGGFLAYLQLDQERDRIKIRELQDHKITMLDKAVKKRTEQLSTMRESIATDFHDETGNMLSAITRQASLLKQKLGDHPQAGQIVENIISNSNALYASSKDFLWHLNHDGDNPQELFDYLTAYGQLYYNQFDISFSSIGDQCPEVQFAPSAALNVIYIFKEAMTNVVKHSGAKEVVFKMHCYADQISYILHDNGSWSDEDPTREHYGLGNINKRCEKNCFGFNLFKQPANTYIEISVPTFTAANL